MAVVKKEEKTIIPQVNTATVTWFDGETKSQPCMSVAIAENLMTLTVANSDNIVIDISKISKVTFFNNAVE